MSCVGLCRVVSVDVCLCHAVFANVVDSIFINNPLSPCLSAVCLPYMYKAALVLMADSARNYRYYSNTRPSMAEKPQRGGGAKGRGHDQRLNLLFILLSYYLTRGLTCPFLRKY